MEVPAVDRHEAVGLEYLSIVANFKSCCKLLLCGVFHANAIVGHCRNAIEVCHFKRKGVNLSGTAAGVVEFTGFDQIMFAEVLPIGAIRRGRAGCGVCECAITDSNLYEAFGHNCNVKHRRVIVCRVFVTCHRNITEKLESSFFGGSPCEFKIELFHGSNRNTSLGCDNCVGSLKKCDRIV